MKIRTAVLSIEAETVAEAHHLRDAMDSAIDASVAGEKVEAELKIAREVLHAANLFTDDGQAIPAVLLSVDAVDEVHTGLIMLAEWCAEAEDETSDVISYNPALGADRPLLEQLARYLEAALMLSAEAGTLLSPIPAPAAPAVQS